MGPHREATETPLPIVSSSFVFLVKRAKILWRNVRLGIALRLHQAAKEPPVITVQDLSKRNSTVDLLVSRSH